MADKERRLKWLLWADAKKFKEGLNTAKKDLGGFQKSAEGTFKNFASAMGAAISIAAVANFTKELVRLSGEVEGVATAFSKIATQSDLQGLRNQVRGTVSDLQLMKSTVSANVLGLPVKELGNLFEFAAKMAQDTGQNVDYLVDSIVRGIGRKSVLILDNLGISASSLKKAMGGIAVESATVGQVAEGVSKIAADYMKEYGGLLDTNSTKIQRITAEWENFKASLAVSPKFTDTISELLTEIEMLVTGYASFWDLAKAVITNNEEAWDKLLERFAAFKQIQQWNTGNDGMYGPGESTRAKETTAAIKEITKSKKKEKTAYEELTEKIAELTKKRQDLALANKDITDITAQINGLNEQKNAVDELIKSLDPKSPREFREEMQKAFDQAIEVRKTLATTFGQRYDRPIIAATSAKEAAKYEPIDTGQLADMSLIAQENLQEVEDYYTQIQQSGERVAQAIQGTFENMVVGVSEAFAALAAGTGSMTDVAKALMNPIADLAISLGVILLGVGKGIEALKASLATITGPIAIIAGAALIALGTAAKAGVASLGSSGGGSYSASSGTYDTRKFSAGQQTYGLKANAMKIEVVGQTQIKNKDIYIAFKNAESSRKQNT